MDGSTETIRTIRDGRIIRDGSTETMRNIKDGRTIKAGPQRPRRP